MCRAFAVRPAYGGDRRDDESGRHEEPKFGGVSYHQHREHPREKGRQDAVGTLGEFHQEPCGHKSLHRVERCQHHHMGCDAQRRAELFEEHPTEEQFLGGDHGDERPPSPLRRVEQAHPLQRAFQWHGCAERELEAVTPTLNASPVAPARTQVVMWMRA